MQRVVPLRAEGLSRLGRFRPLGQNGAPDPFLFFFEIDFSFFYFETEFDLACNKIA
jgi:hypothetical protein